MLKNVFTRQTNKIHRLIVYALELLSFFFCFSIGDVRIISHYEAAVFTARRNEMCEIVEVTFHYLVDRPQVHSEVSGLPFMVSLFVCSFVCLTANTFNG